MRASEWVLDGRYFFTQPMPSGVPLPPYAIALYVFAAPWTALTRTRARCCESWSVPRRRLRERSSTRWSCATGTIAAPQPPRSCCFIPFVAVLIIGNANLTHAFGQSAALVAVAAATVSSLQARAAFQVAGLSVLIAIAFLSHVGLFPLLLSTLLLTALLYRVTGGAALAPAARGVLVASVVALVVSVAAYYGHFLDVYKTLAGARLQAAAAAPASTATPPPPGGRPARSRPPCPRGSPRRRPGGQRNRIAKPPPRCGRRMAGLPQGREPAGARGAGNGPYLCPLRRVFRGDAGQSNPAALHRRVHPEGLRRDHAGDSDARGVHGVVGCLRGLGLPRCGGNVFLVRRGCRQGVHGSIAGTIRSQPSAERAGSPSRRPARPVHKPCGRISLPVLTGADVAACERAPASRATAASARLAGSGTAAGAAEEMAPIASKSASANVRLNGEVTVGSSRNRRNQSLAP